jgi:hypothetical protein
MSTVAIARYHIMICELSRGSTLVILLTSGNTRIVFDHVAEGNQGDEILARTFHWEGLLENLAVTCEGRAVPFADGQYLTARLPRGICYATCVEYIEAKRPMQPRNSAQAK